MHDPQHIPPDLSHLSEDEQVNRLKVMITRVNAVAALTYHMAPTHVDGLTPREIISEVLDELVRIRNTYQTHKSIFEGPTPQHLTTFVFKKKDTRKP